MHKNEEINFLWFLGGHFNIWFVNDEIGKADDGGIMARSRGSQFEISEENMITFFFNLDHIFYTLTPRLVKRPVLIFRRLG